MNRGLASEGRSLRDDNPGSLRHYIKYISIIFVKFIIKTIFYIECNNCANTCFLLLKVLAHIKPYKKSQVHLTQLKSSKFEQFVAQIYELFCNYL